MGLDLEIVLRSLFRSISELFPSMIGSCFSGGRLCQSKRFRDESLMMNLPLYSYGTYYSVTREQRADVAYEYMYWYSYVRLPFEYWYFIRVVRSSAYHSSAVMDHIKESIHSLVNE